MIYIYDPYIVKLFAIHTNTLCRAYQTIFGIIRQCKKFSATLARQCALKTATKIDCCATILIYRNAKFTRKITSKKKIYILIQCFCIKYILCAFKGALSGLRHFLATESPLKMMKKLFLLHLKNSFHFQDI